MEFQIQYARSGDLYIAYEVIGQAPLDLLYVTNYDSTPTLDNWTAEPVVARWVERLASFSRLIVMDVRGIGLLDRITGAATLEDGVDDMLAVLDAAGCERVGFWDSRTRCPSLPCSPRPTRSARRAWCCRGPARPTRR